jgi:signal transduction histidine kinase
MLNLYEKKLRWKWLLFCVALLIVSATLWYTNTLARKLAEEEKLKVEQIADVYKYISTATDITDFGFFIDIIQSNKSVPIISTDNEGNIIASSNLDSVKAATDSTYLKKQLDDMKKFAQPVKFEITENNYQYIYYKHSYLYTQLRYYPVIQLLIIAGFLILSYFLFNTARRSEQNRVWVGMAKETAHQLGTPISSMVGWIDYLKDASGSIEQKKNIIDEMDKDVKRLELIADRFSKIGSSPDLISRNIVKDIASTFEYIKRRAGKRVNFLFSTTTETLHANINPTLFNWVIENILKNALDAIEGSGDISLQIHETERSAIIDISDTGKGIQKSKFTTVFEPGYSTKKRGWGLGLTLAKRIVENYHNGKIFVKQSVPGKGTTFRIIIPKN